MMEYFRLKVKLIYQDIKYLKFWVGAKKIKIMKNQSNIGLYKVVLEMIGDNKVWVRLRENKKDLY